MGLKQNKRIWLFLLLACYLQAVSAQYDIDSSTYMADTAAHILYDPLYHFHDSAQGHYEHSKASKVFDSTHWKKMADGLSFDEVIEKKEPPPDRGPTASGFNFDPRIKYVLIGLAILALAFIVYKLIPVYNRKNAVLNNQLLIDLDDLDEDQIRAFELDTHLAQALREGDYRKAYRLRYLDVLKQLVSRNLIFFRKERTNYEYLLQLNGKKVYEPFRLLTFNFDGIWYGDLMIDKDRYETLEIHFKEFNDSMTA
jgi:hypothetical protein